jgi:hypothetical protein
VDFHRRAAVCTPSRTQSTTGQRKVKAPVDGRSIDRCSQRRVVTSGSIFGPFGRFGVTTFHFCAPQRSGATASTAVGSSPRSAPRPPSVRARTLPRHRATMYSLFFPGKEEEPVGTLSKDGRTQPLSSQRTRNAKNRAPSCTRLGSRQSSASRGEGGIRTLGTLPGTPDFESGTF